VISSAQSSTRKGPLDIGDRFLKFEIKGLLGQGGHAWVYHGYDPFLDRHVAIKVIPNPAEPGRDLPRRAQLEARVLCRLQHRNVVHVIDAGATSEGAVYIIMEVLHGRTLREVIHDFQRLNVSEVLSLGAEIADGVQAAHEQNAIHRDLKPENVFVLPGNAVKVLDFGIAKFLGYGAATTQKDLLHGTLLYMSPEHLQGFGVTVRSDIFALGTMLYEAFVGQPPCMIGVQEPSLNALSWRQINHMPPPLDEFTGTVPPFVARAIQRMVAKEPADRFATMAEVATVLRSNARRYEEEFQGAVARPRELWHHAPLATSPTSATRLSHAATEAQEHAPSSPPAPANTGQSGDTAPLFRGALSAPDPAPSPLAPASTLSPHAAQPAPSSEAASVPRAGRGVVLQLLAAAVAVGTASGLAIGVAQAHRHPTAVARASAEQPRVVLSAAPAAAVAPSPATAAPTEAAPGPSAAPTAIVSARPSPGPARPAAPVTPQKTATPQKTPARAAGLPASGLWDMSDLDTPTKPKPAASAAPPKPRPKAIFGADDIK
jgi:serine/threonine protein kinase